jgi:hypothetical protein
MHVAVDDHARTIALDIPHARVLDVVVTRLETYDERNGLWNRFQPADRDSVYQHVRAQLAATGDSLGLARHADSSAVALLRVLLAAPGYAVSIRFQQSSELDGLRTR